MRKTFEQKIARLEENRAAIDKKIQAEKQRQREKQRKAERRGNYIIGAVVMNAAEKDPAFKETLWRILDKHTTRKADRLHLGLLPITVDDD